MAMARTHERRPVSHQDRRAARHLLALPAALFAGVIALAMAYVAYVLWPRWPAAPVAPDAPTLPIVIAGVNFNVPPAAIRQRLQRKPGTHERIDLVFLWPSLVPPDPSAKLAPVSSAYAVDRIFMTVVASDTALSPAERIRSIYPRYLETQLSEGPGGLAVRPFRDGSPYQGEELVFDHKTTDGFATRCTRDGPGPTLGICLYDTRIGAVDITVRFPRVWLEEWPSVAAALNRLIATLHAPAR